MSFLKKIFSLIITISIYSFPFCYASENDIEKIEVFIQQESLADCIQDNNCFVYNIDAAEDYLNRVFSNLSSNQDEAYMQSMRIFESPEWAEHELKIKELQHNVLRAWILGVKKHPAIVINDTFVVYGTTDIEKAKRDFELRVNNE
ncbi:protein of unknown function DUF1525 [Gilliamella apicola]|uniref:TIGR03757 family integrating conjugative element protein n=1 Tax=Gilliamella apicola TaxID=1196095 RepID=UPI00042EF469|nr:TIGR03757 family integrating conjugative element protein [Gilliamella apicola]AHN27250.1 protein of unknown function DUF1525 [Gilliamella apicola]PXV96585.1 integrating conjugative element protein (TIGR03757 family) [Gilliamella apicola]